MRTRVVWTHSPAFFEQILTKHVTIVGVGLLGASLALALRRTGLADTVVGIDRDAAALERALERGIIDSIGDAPGPTDLLVVALPVPFIAQTVRKWANHAKLIVDVGSVKSPVLEELADDVPTHYVPCHPMSGAESSGVDAAQEGLFAGNAVALTPIESTMASSIAKAQELWSKVSGSVHVMTPSEHDEIVAVTSHLPHLLAYTFALQVEPKHLPVTGNGFKDFTRIARSHPELWRSILWANRGPLLRELKRYQANLTQASDALSGADDASLASWLEVAAERKLR